MNNLTATIYCVVITDSSNDITSVKNHLNITAPVYDITISDIDNNVGLTGTPGNICKFIAFNARFLYPYGEMIFDGQQVMF